MKTGIFKQIYHFYRYDCCWPYAVSFYLVLVIYWLDFFVGRGHRHWTSVVAFGVVFVYYLYILRLYFQGRLAGRDNRFFLGFLSFKIIIGLVLLISLIYLS